jgi:hypothetical protein
MAKRAKVEEEDALTAFQVSRDFVPFVVPSLSPMKSEVLRNSDDKEEAKRVSEGVCHEI